MGDGENSETGDEEEEEFQSAGDEDKADQKSGGEEGPEKEDEVQKIDVLTLSSESDEEVDSGRRQESSDSNGSEDSDDSSDSDFEDEREQNGGREQVRGNTNLPESSRASSRSTDCYSSTIAGALDVSIADNPAYDWISARVLEDESIFRSGKHDLLTIGKKINGHSGRIWKVEGMKTGEHVALWAGEFKFTMYHLTVKDMNIRPPFTFLQQKVLARLVVPSSSRALVYSLGKVGITYLILPSF